VAQPERRFQVVPEENFQVIRSGSGCMACPPEPRPSEVQRP
jgi:hypothetical protein